MPIVLMIGLDADERTRLVLNPIQKVLARIFRKTSDEAALQAVGVPQHADE